jgi:hypothetical protein
MPDIPQVKPRPEPMPDIPQVKPRPEPMPDIPLPYGVDCECSKGRKGGH